MFIDFVYVKYIVMIVGFNIWGLVFYNNLEVFFFFLIEFFVMGEGNFFKKCMEDEFFNWFSIEMWFLVLFFCVFGFFIFFFGFLCWRVIFVMGFIVLGVVNKLLIVVINLMIWMKYVFVLGIFGLFICIFGGVFY